MNLISCDGCGVILDANKLKFPLEIENSDGSIDGSKAAWNGSDYVPFVACPVCRNDILKGSGA